MINVRGCGRNAVKGGRVHGIAAVETATEQEHMDEAAICGGSSGRNGVRFGRGGYQT